MKVANIAAPTQVKKLKYIKYNNNRHTTNERIFLSTFMNIIATNKIIRIVKNVSSVIIYTS